ncbi:uroporphyrinogen III methyltransferase [Geotalea uraniireducens]|uniref:uroporphyrinogen-III C-methyltransferase n=1 Tax=Geotalea uraniireducens TaxID=351604 RepID=A0ABM8EGC4_9BACT|nr:uroporphyrinogen-III C-methyltransferase [Geotalea uraniireducens]BDV41329.1 uroporphyrinogen III methyltransferase [Geotalea uraniireducens]
MAEKSTQQGLVYLIGAGPGDPDLITVKGRDCIARADIVIYDYLANDALLTHARPGTQLIYAGKVGGQHNREQWQINELLVEKALAGNVVARLKGGDPFVFGRGGEECEALLAAGIPFEIVPGVTAGIGAAAYAGIPLTHREFTTSVAFVTGHESPGKDVSEIDWQGLSLGSGTIVFYMGVKNLPLIAANLIAHGRSADTPVALVRWGTRPEQEVITGTLATIAEAVRLRGFKAPAITIVGDVVSLRDKLRWFDNRPLFGKRVVVTRAADQAGAFSRKLADLGAQVLECPTIEIVPPEQWSQLDEAIAGLSDFDWLVLTSANAVQYFFARLQALGKDSRALGACRVCAVGPKTAALLRTQGVKADLIPTDYKGEGVVTTLRSQEIRGTRVLFPKGDRAREVIEKGLKALGAEVIAPVAYRNITPASLSAEVVQALEERRIHCITFTSSSTVQNLAALLGENRLLRLLEGVLVASIGPITSRSCRDLGLAVHVEPREYTLDALTDEIVSAFAAHD